MSESFPQAFGRYQLRERLALGGMAELFLAEVAGAHGFAKTVVIKRILPHLAADTQFTSMFISEAKITAQLAHPKIAQTFELGTEDHQLFIVMEYIDGLDVLAMLRECAHRRVRVPAELSVYILKEVLDALDFAHKLNDAEGQSLGIVHRDVSPSNILLSRRGDVKLVDFGIALAAAEDGNTKAGTLKGKYGYMSPEQVLGQPVSPKSDIFAAGVVLSEMLMGRRLFAAANELDVLLMVRDVDLGRLERFGGHIEEGLASLLHWALRKDPGDRYHDAATFRDALDEWLFEQRHRISSAQLADIVNSLYQDALLRRKEGLEKIAAIQPAQPNAPTMGIADHGLGDRKPGAEPSTIMQVSFPSDDEVDLALGEITLPADGVVHAENGEDEIVNFQLAPTAAQSDVGGIALIARSSSRAVERESVETDSGSLEIDFGSLNDEPESEASDADKSSDSYDTISAAVASLSPVEPDPSSMDFDDSDVSGISDQDARRMPTVDELAKSLPPSPPTLERGNEPAERRGRLSEDSALGSLYRTTAARESGKIVLSFGGVRKEIFFKRGVPEFVSSNIASELFGAYLVRTEVITSGELDMALAVMPHFGGKLGDTLVGLGLMKPLEVFRHLTRQVRSKLIEVCTWIEGTYEWFPGVACPKQAFPLDLDPLEVYGAGAMAMTREGIESWCRGRAERRPVAARSSVAVPELFQVGGIRQYQESLDGTRSVAQIIEQTTNDDEGLHELQLLFLLLNTRLVSDARTEGGS